MARGGSKARRAEIISLSGLIVYRGRRLVLRDFTWNTRQGENWFIMGPNGSGKTTLVDVIMGLVWPREGSVAVLGREFGRTHLGDLRQLIGYVSPWIFKRMPQDVPVQEVVASGFDASIGRLGKLGPRIRKSVGRALGLVGGRNLLRQRFGELSSGQQLKVILARALVHAPKLLILDEPFSLLDVGSRIRIYEDLERIARRRDAPQIILVTHHKEDLLPLFSHGLLMGADGGLVMGERAQVLRADVLARIFGVKNDIIQKYFV